jgi:ferredoxin-NADP reductase
VAEVLEETYRVRSIVLEPPQWPGHLAGQHVDVRLTAEDRYQAQRSYSIASAPEDGYLVLTVERLEDGEVSRYLVDELRPGDELELRGPIGGYRDELARIAAYDEVDVRFTLTRERPDEWRGYRRRIDDELLAEVAWPPDERPLVYVCGPTAFVEAATNGLVRLGHAAERIKTSASGLPGDLRP